MTPEVGVGVVLGLLVLLPLGAMWVAGRWRDPPRERWGPSERELAQAAGDPEVARHRRRVELGLGAERDWDAARRAVADGVAAPPALRDAARRLAADRIATLDAELERAARTRWQWYAYLALVTVAAVASLVFTDSSLGIGYLVLAAVLTWVRSDRVLRRGRARAEAALAANSRPDDRPSGG